MSNVLICQGAYAKRPYYASDDCQNLYSIEELCYYLYHNAYLLDDQFLSAKLVEWVDEELQLPELAKALKKQVNRPDALIRLVSELRNQIGYYEPGEWDELISEIGRNNKLSVEERRKFRADGFLRDNKYALALDEYDVLLRETSLSETKMRAKVYHNMGVCTAKLFMFRRAADYFSKAYDAYANTESYVSMLAACKMYMTQKEYLTFLSEHKESYEDSLALEHRIELLKASWNNQAAKRFIDSLSAMKEESSDFYDGIASMTYTIKQEYKDSVFRNKG